jgi:hypothetical protein
MEQTSPEHEITKNEESKSQDKDRTRAECKVRGIRTVEASSN